MGNSSPGLFVAECALLGFIPASIAYWRGLTGSGRSEFWQLFGWWVLGAALFVIALPSSLLKKRQIPTVVEGPPAVASCEACGGLVSNAVAACPHCGHPRNVPRERKEGRSALIPIGTTAIVLTIMVAAALHPSLFIFGLPGCGSDAAEDAVKSAFADAPLGRVLGLSIVEFREPETVAKTASSVRCSAQVALSNATTHQLGYILESRADGQTSVRAQLDGQPP